MEKNNFALLLRQSREEAGLTQQQVAEMLKIERSTYSYYENGKTTPSCSFVLKISRILNMDYRIFMDIISETIFDDNEKELPSTQSNQENRKFLSLSDVEQNIILSYREMTDEKKNMVNLICLLSDVNEEE